MKNLAMIYSLRDAQGEGIKYLFYEILIGHRSLDVNKKSKVRRAMPLYLGKTFMLTKIVYFALGAI